MARNVRIVPAAGGPNCRGTRVFFGDKEIAVTRLELVADIETGVWRARIDVLADIDGAIVAELANDGS